jgi:DNA-binding MarR family transcriptional regulator
MAGRLLTELKQTKPFQRREDEAYLNLIRTADHLRRQVADLLKPHEVSPAQYNVLRILRGALSENDERDRARTCGDICTRLVTFEPDLTRLLDRLVKQGLVERERDEEDRRVVRSRITKKGIDLLNRLDAPIADAHRQSLGRLGQDRLLQLIDLLEDVRAP